MADPIYTRKKKEHFNKGWVHLKVKKNLLNLFLCCEVQLFRLEMKYYFIHMAATTGLTVPHSIGPILVHLFKCMGSNFGNGITPTVSNRNFWHGTRLT